MSITERIKEAEEKRDDALANGTLYDVTYWNGYIDALKSCIFKIEKKEC